MATRSLKLSFVTTLLTGGKVPETGEDIEYGGRWWVVRQIIPDRDIIVLED